MITLEQVERLRQYGDISYDEARHALEEGNGDILEAIIILEKQGIIQEPINGGYHSSKNEQDDEKSSGENNLKKDSKEDNESSFSELMGRLFRWFGEVIRRGNMNHFEVIKGENKIISIPSTILALLLLFMFWVTIPLIVVGLFFGYRYTFVGPDLGKEKINEAMDSVANAADKFKNEVKGDKPNGEDSNN